MSTIQWSQLAAEARRQLREKSPHLARCTSEDVLESFVGVLTLSQTSIRAELQPDRLDPTIIINPSPAEGDRLAGLVDNLRQVTADSVRTTRAKEGFKIKSALDGNAFTQWVVDMLADGAVADDITGIARLVATAVQQLRHRADELVNEHLQEIVARDLPALSGTVRHLSEPVAWLLAPEWSGDPKRGTVISRRLQAFALYGAVSHVLREAGITTIIDAGQPLAGALAERLGVTAPELRRLRNVRSLESSVAAFTDFSTAVSELKVHAVPLHQWPASAAKSWEESPWMQRGHATIIRRDYVANTTSEDALNALRDDLLRPLTASRFRPGLERNYALQSFARSFEFPSTLWTSPARRQLVAAFNRAIIGQRGTRAFAEGVTIWHRRAASLSALRHEHRTERPGWPPLCAPWQSADGRYQIVPLTSAAGLVEEGNALNHCVGGYYEICRRGDTQILSLRRDGTRMATVEFRLTGPADEAPRLERGQFQSAGNHRPVRDLHEALQAFMDDLQSGIHGINAAAIIGFRKRMARTPDYSWQTDTLPLAHARETFALYRAMLPRSAPADFDGWCAQYQLADAIDQAIEAIAAEHR